MSSPPALRLEAVTKRYPRATTPALCSLSFEVPTGAVTALVGANGSGKSTLLRLLMGLLTPTAGRVEVLGIAPARGNGVMRRIGYATADDRLYPELSVLDNLAYRACLRGVPSPLAPAAARDVLERFGLGEFAARTPGSLSAGERQRALLAASLVHAPELLLLDEPSTALDILAQSHLHALLEDAPASGRSVLIATHHLEEVWLLATELLVLNAGRLVYAGPTRALAGSLCDLRRHLHALFSETAPCAA